MASLPFRPLGSSGIPVSVMSLGSWRTFERISRDQGEAVMRAAREEGINFLDDARYNDETGPHRSRPATRKSSSVSCSGPAAGCATRSSSPTSCGGSSGRSSSGGRARRVPRADGARPHRPDLRHPAARHDHSSLREVVESASGLIASGMARHWAVAMWSAPQLAEALDIAAELDARHRWRTSWPAASCNTRAPTIRRWSS